MVQGPRTKDEGPTTNDHPFFGLPGLAARASLRHVFEPRRIAAPDLSGRAPARCPNRTRKSGRRRAVGAIQRDGAGIQPDRLDLMG
jgi:hypothetical protein